ncbi:hypothetical protein ZWY2020_001708 [Hordeum vulgare]|nr:hypothetical protein ZWY2020_001708 [Hordeum vulgare]
MPTDLSSRPRSSRIRLRSVYPQFLCRACRDVTSCSLFPTVAPSLAWSFLDDVWAVFLVDVVIFLALVFTSRRGDTLTGAVVPPFAALEVDLLPCEDPDEAPASTVEASFFLGPRSAAKAGRSHPRHVGR